MIRRCIDVRHLVFVNLCFADKRNLIFLTKKILNKKKNTLPPFQKKKNKNSGYKCNEGKILINRLEKNYRLILPCICYFCFVDKCNLIFLRNISNKKYNNKKRKKKKKLTGYKWNESKILINRLKKKLIKARFFGGQVLSYRAFSPDEVSLKN